LWAGFHPFALLNFATEPLFHPAPRNAKELAVQADGACAPLDSRIPTLDHPSEQRSLAGDPASRKNKNAARVGHPASLS
jgi:hypothetical protein